VAFEQLPNLARRQWPEFVNEADAGVKLPKASQSLFKAGHSAQNHSNPALIKYAPRLLESGHFESVGFVNDQQRGWIGNISLTVEKNR
jgi:hypothetical protein